MYTIATLFGIYPYTYLIIGVKVLPDIEKLVINNILDGLDTEGYIDDCGYWSVGTFDNHLARVDEILTWLEGNGLKCNPLKCDWLVHKTNFLRKTMELCAWDELQLQQK